MLPECLYSIIPLWMLNKITSVAMRNDRAYMALVTSMEPGSLERIGRRRLLAMFHLAAERVPHYKRHLRKLGVDHTKIRTIEELVSLADEIALTKDNYKKTTPSPNDLCVDGACYPSGSLMTCSSGYSTGSPTFWVRGKEELDAQIADVTLGMRLLFRVDNVPTAHLVLFHPGPWVSAPTCNRLLARHGTFIPAETLTPKEAVYFVRENLACERPAFRQMAVYGYPPYLEEMIDVGERMGFDWSAHLVHLLCAGQNLSESERYYLKSRLHPEARIISNLGSSDISASMAFENPFTIRLRQEMLKDVELRKALAIDPTEKELALEPSIFGYNCTSYHVLDRGSKLYWSTLVPNTVEPLIFYDLGDSGFVLNQKDVRRRLSEYYGGWEKVRGHFGEDLRFLDVFPTPMVGVYGRYDGTVNLMGELITPNSIKDGIISAGLWDRTAHFTLKELVVEGVHRGIQVNVELVDGVSPTYELREQYLKGILAHLSETNEAYRAALRKLTEGEGIDVQLHALGTLDRGGIKLKHISR